MGHCVASASCSGMKRTAEGRKNSQQVLSILCEQITWWGLDIWQTSRCHSAWHHNISPQMSCLTWWADLDDAQRSPKTAALCVCVSVRACVRVSVCAFGLFVITTFSVGYHQCSHESISQWINVGLKLRLKALSYIDLSFKTPLITWTLM